MISKRRKIVKFTMLALGILLFGEVITLHVNQIPIELTPLRFEKWVGNEDDEGNHYYPHLVCKLYNPRLTPIHYSAIGDSMVAYRAQSLDRPEEKSENHYDFYNSWCTANMGFTLPPRSSREVWMWVPDAPQELDVTIYYKDTSLLSWFSPFYREFHHGGEARTIVDFSELEEVEITASELSK